MLFFSQIHVIGKLKCSFIRKKWSFLFFLKIYEHKKCFNFAIYRCVKTTTKTYKLKATIQESSALKHQLRTFSPVRKSIKQWIHYHFVAFYWFSSLLAINLLFLWPNIFDNWIIVSIIVSTFPLVILRLFKSKVISSDTCVLERLHTFRRFKWITSNFLFKRGDYIGFRCELNSTLSNLHFQCVVLCFWYFVASKANFQPRFHIYFDLK